MPLAWQNLPRSVPIHSAPVKIDEERLTTLIRDNFDLRPYGILKMLDLIKPIYTPTAAYGHFGREDIDLSWERTDRADALRGAAAA